MSPDYFNVMGIPLRAGRLFDDRDTAATESVVIISEATARKYWPGENPIGQRTVHKTPMTVIGVVGGVRGGSLREEGGEQIYRALPQFLFALHDTALVVSTAGPQGRWPRRCGRCCASGSRIIRWPMYARCRQ
ncbi:MAG: hypothetical protein FJW31_01740 [Acidobacteria bacterium]|nr:hypothetical protein [Acidobacteriota bacterium]